MFRLLKYAPVVIPLVMKFVRSPRGQKALNDVRTRVQNRRGGPTSPPR